MKELNGTWSLNVTLPSQGGTATIELMEGEGGALTGKYVGALGNATLTGTVKGSEVEFSFDSQAGKITYKGTVSGDKLEGTCSYGQLGDGTFEGMKSEAPASEASSPDKWPSVDLGQPTMIFDVKDMEKSIDFYTRLGFERTVVRGHDGERHISSSDNPTWATFEYGNQSLHLMLIGMNMMNFEVADIQATSAGLRERGLNPRPAGPNGSGITLADPEGNIIYIMPIVPPEDGPAVSD